MCRSRWPLIYLLALAWLGCASEERKPTTIDYVSAFVYQSSVKSEDGKLLTAASIGEEVENGAAALSDPDPRIIELVRRAVRSDFERHREDVLVRIHLAQGGIFEGGEATNGGVVDREKAQGSLWKRFIDDPRWLRRVLQELKVHAQRERVNLPGAIEVPEEPATITSLAEITRIRNVLAEALGNPGSGCAANPLVAIHALAGHGDPVVVAHVFDAVRMDRGIDPKLIASQLLASGVIVQD